MSRKIRPVQSAWAQNCKFNSLCYCTEIRTSNLNVCLLKMAWVTYLEFTFMFYFQSRFAVLVLGFKGVRLNIWFGFDCLFVYLFAF